MNYNYFDYRESIAENLISFLRQRGFSKLSFSKLTNISRPTIDQILKGESPSPKQYNSQITKINETFQLPDDYFIVFQEEPMTTSRYAYAYSDHGRDADKSPKTMELLNALDDILDVYSIYLK
ncbi:XRE family transcriptional regulator [Paenibacillus oenotherae]|uniref:XRE family transcriptional regulator n=1 Tax=Paenibacillus oenotherae TaxID=1435645 RepID=A0ABS7D753_9BACL|nr:helix-turn-helix domain-containing protein [Paenibacillus oenotherae]MBW7475772.1 XRE family transcriptional regulator [Paenibacillus oenotherae]